MALRRSRRRRKRGPDRRSAWRFLVFAVVTISLTAYLTVRITGTDLGSGMQLRAVFDDVSGLRTGDRVKVAGSPVGRVTSVKVDDGRAVVSMKVRSSLKIPDDSSVVIRWRDLIGERQIYLEPGSSQAMAKDGQTLTRTRSAADLGSLINALAPLVGGVDPNEINKILQSFAVALDGNQGRIDQITTNLAALLRILGARSGTIHQMIGDYKTITDALAARDRQIVQTIGSLTELTQAFAQDRGVLDTATVKLSDVATNLDKTIGGSDRQLGQLVDSTASLMEIAHRNMGQIEKLIKSLPMALQAVLTILDGGRFARGNALCINIEHTDKCPFPENLPPPPASGSGGGPAISADAARLTPGQQRTFQAMVRMLFLGGQNGGAR
jgi:phospholipid/cholesterol/gamma-HCH transport system substrate-binding protein